MGEADFGAAKLDVTVDLDLPTAATGDGLRFTSVKADAGEKRLLWGVSGHAPSGKLLAIMGPSGAGKTTLLNCLAGYLPMAGGSVTLDGMKLSKKNRRHISYVLQADIFFPNLTLRETLRFSALLRLPMGLGFREKLNRVEDTIRTLHLEECADTIIGNVLVRGLSGGEKKRANIGCELLTSPSVLLLDEPTSGLDSSGAFSLLETVRELAHGQGRTVVASIHQPSSQMYHMFDDLMLLAKGKVAYYGPASKAMAYFSRSGLHCTLHYNPADYMLELVTIESSRKILIGEDPVQKKRPSRRTRWRRWLGGGRGERRGKEEEESMKDIVEYPESPRFPHKDATFSGMEEAKPRPSVSVVVRPKWPTPWYWQFLVLTARTFWQSRHIILSRLNMIQAFIITLVVAIVWFQVPFMEESIRDRYGMLFFSVVYWGFNPLILATSSFPAERIVISKERSSGSFHLSAYYLAKLLSELPLVILLPTFYIIVTFWSAGLGGASAFFTAWFTLILNSFVAQSLGLLIGATIMDIQGALVTASVIMLGSMLLGGFYVQTLPFWLEWAQYISFVTYSFNAMLIATFPPSQQFSCNLEESAYVACNVTAPGNATIPGTAVLEELNVNIPFYGNVLVLVGYALVFRILAYLSLRYLHRK